MAEMHETMELKGKTMNNWQVKVYYLAFMAIFLLGCWSMLDSDEEIIKRFQENKNKFQTISEMCLAEKPFRFIDKNGGFVNYENPSEEKIDPIRMEQYREFFKSAGVTGINICREPLQVFFTMSVSGLVNRGSSKGIALIRGNRQKIGAGNLDTGSEEKIRFRSVEGDWYLYREDD